MKKSSESNQLKLLPTYTYVYINSNKRSLPTKAVKIMNLALFPFGPHLPRQIEKKVMVKIGHSPDTLPIYRNNEQNYKF